MNLETIAEAFKQNQTITKILKFEKFHGRIILNIDKDDNEIKVINFENINYYYKHRGVEQR